EEMGWRTTAQNYNLNRDYVKADAPEMRAMLALVEAWDPIAVVDLHATNGAQFEHDISVQIEPLHAGDPELGRLGRALRDGLLARLEAQGSLPLPFYPEFEAYDDPASGIADGVAPPRFSHGYFRLRNRFGILVETHSWKEYPVRVRITRNLVGAMLEATARDGSGWLRAAAAADARAAGLAGQPVALDWVATDDVRTVDFRGYAFTRTPSGVSGALMTRYDESTPQLWRMPLRDTLVPGRQVAAPGPGAAVPAAGRGRPRRAGRGLPRHRDAAGGGLHRGPAAHAAGGRVAPRAARPAGRKPVRADRPAARAPGHGHPGAAGPGLDGRLGRVQQ